MNKDVAYILKNRLINGKLNFVNIISGLIQRVERKEVVENNTVSKFFPISTDISDEKGNTLDAFCDEFIYGVFPDSNKKGIIYFEENGGLIPLGPDSRGNEQFKSSLNVICWLNREKITGKTYESIQSYCMNEVLKALQLNTKTNENVFSAFFVALDYVLPTDSSIFAKYSYDEARTQYLMPPFEFFGVRLKISFALNRKCVNPITLNPTEC